MKVKMNMRFFLFGLLVLSVTITGCALEQYEPPISYGENTYGDPTPYELEVPMGLPPIVQDASNPLTIEGIALGRRLFYDPILSLDSSISCASCHSQDRAFTDDGNRFSVGVDGIPGTKNAMALFNLNYAGSFFWDGRSNDLVEQAKIPVEDPVEMHEQWPNVVQKLSRHPEYPSLFLRAFGTEEITADLAAKAIAQFERTLISGNSKYDKFRNRLPGGDFNQLEFDGYSVFFSERGDCFHCHDFTLFTDHDFHNNGIDSVLNGDNYGRYAVTGDINDWGKFKTTSLRNIAVTAPYMHDGRFQTLEEVIEHYARIFVNPPPDIDPLLTKDPNKPPLTAYEKLALKAFLETLTDDEFLTNPDFSSPF